MKYLICAALLFLIFPATAFATNWGVHLLSPEELEFVLPYAAVADEFYVTVPLSIYDRRSTTWNHFFSLARKHNITPIIRLSTHFVDGNWQRPVRQEIVESSVWLRTIYWPGKRILVLFNEPNHAAEWGGQVDPVDYAQRIHFAAQWFSTEPYDYSLLVGGMDAAAPTTTTMMDNQQFIRIMLDSEPDMLMHFDGFAAHAYPNPAFSSPPYSTREDGVTSFEYELDIYNEYTDKNLDIYVTETGWVNTPAIRRWLPNYYQYLDEHVFSHPQIRAATVFVLRGHNGPFEDFSLLTHDAQPTVLLEALVPLFDR